MELIIRYTNMMLWETNVKILPSVAWLVWRFGVEIVLTAIAFLYIAVQLVWVVTQLFDHHS